MNSTDIANMALGRIGISRAIASLDEQSNEAKTCKRFYDQCRREVLRSFPYGFSLRPQALALVADETFPGYTFVYQYPQKCLMIRAVCDQYGLRFGTQGYLCRDQQYWPESIRYPFRMGLREDGETQVILTDLESAYAMFTMDVTNTNVFPADFVSVFAWRLAMEIGGPLQCKADFIQLARGEYLFWRSHASAQSLNEARDDRKPESESIACRS